MEPDQIHRIDCNRCGAVTLHDRDTTKSMGAWLAQRGSWSCSSFWLQTELANIRLHLTAPREHFPHAARREQV
jgi:hypothetical protein